MQVKLSPYLNFRGNAREAMEFYHSVFGGSLKVQTFEDAHTSKDPDEGHLVMHALLEGDNGVEFMASDVPGRMEFIPGNNVHMSLMGDNEALLSSCFEKLAEGGTVTMQLQKAMWGDTFGMCTDRFGIGWMVNISAHS